LACEPETTDTDTSSKHIAHCRNYNGSEGYLIVINTSGSEQHVDLSALDILGKDKLRVVTAAPNSRLDAG
jgi:hypothetical protein